MRDDAAKGEGLAPSPGPLPRVPPRPRAFLEWEARVAASKRPMPPFTVSWDESGRYFLTEPGGSSFLSFPPDIDAGEAAQDHSDRSAKNSPADQHPAKVATADDVWCSPALGGRMLD